MPVDDIEGLPKLPVGFESGVLGPSPNVDPGTENIDVGTVSGASLICGSKMFLLRGAAKAFLLCCALMYVQ